MIHLVIITNGSYKSSDWWRELATVLDRHDEINWSIDGWDQYSNQQYRVNCDWSSIMQGIDTFKSINSLTYCVWATIAFRFNQDHLEYIKSLAVEKNMDLFQLTKSTKFGSHYPASYGVDDPLQPTHDSLVSSGQRFERVFDQLTLRPRPSDDLKSIFLDRANDLIKQQKYSGICMIGNKGVFVNSQGEFYPCCWTANRYQHNLTWNTMAKQRFNLNHRTFAEIISDDFWTTDFLQFDSLECTTKCTPQKLHDRSHSTEW
jgi:MoaA/NifB/PqqE/SkfB family radical SAM enzyme